MNLLNFPDWRMTELTEETTHYFIRAEYRNSRTAYPNCRSCLPGIAPVQKYGMRLRSFKDAPVRGKIVSGLLAIQKYKCPFCRAIFQDTVPELQENSRLTKRLISYIEAESIRKSFLTVARETGVSESTVREIFERFVEVNREKIAFETPRILGIDDVYIGGVARCILTDIQRKRVIEILPKRDMPTVYGHLIEMKNRANVEIVAMDMSRPFFNSVTDAFPRAEIVIDTFHVQRMINEAINIFLRSLRSSLALSGRRNLLRDRFLLMKRSFNLTGEEKKTLLEWRSRLSPLDEIYRLKEEFLTLWRLSNREQAEAVYERWRESIPVASQFVFQEILNAVGNWHREIFNYFDYRVTNAYTESANNLIKSLQRQGRGCSFRVIRAKMLYKGKS